MTGRSYKIILFLLISVILIIIYLQYTTNYAKIYQLQNSEFIVLTNITINENIAELEPPLTWKDTDQKIFNLDFEYILTSHICNDNNKEITGVIVVTSYFANVELRSSMRRAFTSKELLEEFKLVRIFLLGLPASKETSVTQNQVENEAERFGDIIQGNFQEAYRNLTYKHLMGLVWASYNCQNVTFIMKMDDDIVVDMHKLKQGIIDQYLPLQQENNHFLAGYQLDRGPVRNSSSKWYVSPSEYPQETYPPYLSGWFYITTPRTAKRLIQIGRKMDYFWIDDVFVTGIVAKRLRIKHLRLNYFYAKSHLELKCCMDDVKYNRSCKFIFGPNGGDNNMFYDYNLAMQSCLMKKNCKDSSKCEEPLNQARNFERFYENEQISHNGSIEIYKF